MGGIRFNEVSTVALVVVSLVVSEERRWGRGGIRDQVEGVMAGSRDALIDPW